ncbi:MAG: HAMP domain-containing histidine kinase [Chloroflexota bacterium]|nr:HAMP domain-containing histidine kinase [Chloroflexota bacterium]
MAWRGRRGGPWAGGRGWQRGFGCVFGLVFLLVLGSVATVAATVISHFGSVGLAAGLLGLVLIFGFVGGTFRRTASTLDDLSDAARRVSGGDFAARVPQPRRGPPPLRELVRGFNTMAERLERDERKRRSLLADVSHELRTPLAVVQGNLEALLDGVYPADEAHLSGILEETRVLTRLVDDLRTLTLSEAGSLPLHREPTDVAVLAAEVAASFRPAAEAAGVTLTASVDEGVPLLDVDPVRTHEVLTNLVANALRYTPTGGRVTIAGALETGQKAGQGARARLAVTDTGPGMAPEVLAHVFERFWKSPDSRGTGLGLAIARNLVEAHGGQIGADSRPGKGTTVWFTLPVDDGGS